MSHSHRITLKIADIVFGLDAAPEIPLDLDDTWKQFVCTEDPDIVIEISGSPIPESGLGQERVFQCRDMWAVFEGHDRVSLILYHPYSPSEIQRLIVWDKELRHARFFVRASSRLNAVNPFDYPLGQIFMAYVLSRNRGLMVHASGVDDHGRGYLFAGNSGQGKSTLSSLWESHGRVLNDDRVIIRHVDNGFRVYPTPWHGSYANVSAQGVALDKVFLISHGHANSIRKRRSIESTCELLARSFPPLWDAKGMAFSLDLLSPMMQEIPCFELAFVPDETVIDLVRCAK